MRTWKLTDAEAIASANKYTFFKPSAQTIAALQQGEFVQLIFEIVDPPDEGPGAERMWVEIVEVDAAGGYRGLLRNDPSAIEDLKFGDQVAFEPCHIIKTERDEDGGLVEKYSSRCFVSNKILNEGAKVGRLWREDPHTSDDSGWRFLAGDERGGYLIDPGNCQCVSIGAVLRSDDSFIELLEHPVGARFKRRAETNTFEPDDSPMRA